jgi:Flp pilus assembly protein TadD
MRSALSFRLSHAAALAVALVCFHPPITAQKAPSGAPRSRPNIGTAPERTLTVRGKVLDADDHSQLEGVKVELRSFSGATVATAFTRGAGDFEFPNLTAGNYDLIAQLGGYRTLTERLDVNGSVLGLSLELHPNAPKTTATPGPSAVSARELSIPRKAHDAMEKGEALMYQKSDYQGSIKQFERAVQEYPDYYEAYTQMGIAYLHLQNDAGAEQALHKSLELSQERYIDALFWLATLLNDSNRFADAEPFARKAIEVDSNSWQADAELARSLLGLNRPAEAEKSALAAAKLRPENALLYLILANVHSQLENAPALLEDLNNYLRLAPTGPMADQARAQRKQLQEALGNAQQSSPAPSLNH